VCQRASIDDDAIAGWAILLDVVYERAFTVGLEKCGGGHKLSGPLTDALLYFGFTLAQQVQVGSVNHKDCHEMS
jgi:hypothetical protein